MDKEKERLRIGQRIAAVRKEVGMTQKELAEKTNIQPCHVSRIEQGHFSVGFDTLEKIAQAMGKTVDFIDAGEVDFKSSNTNV